MATSPFDRQSPLVPRGFTPLLDVEKPKPPEPKPVELPDWIPDPLEKVVIGAATLLNPLAGPVTAFAISPTGSAAMRTDNIIGSAIANWQDTAGVDNALADPNYSSWEDIKGTRYEEYWNSTFIRSNNPGYTAALKASIDRQDEDRRTIAASGLTGTLATVFASVVDPTILIPGGGEIALVGKGAWRVGKGAIAGARAGAIGVAAQEAGLQATQDVRTGEESIANIATGVVLGGVLGGGIAAMLSPARRVASEEALERIEATSTLDLGTASAMATPRASVEDLTIAGKTARTVAELSKISPNMRGNFRVSPLARQTYQEISSNPFRQQLHQQGKTLGGSVEDNIRVSLAETIEQALPAFDKLYSAAKKAPGPNMPYDEFKRSVGQAMRRNDIGDNDYISQAAALWRSKVIDPLSRQAVKQGLLPEDVTVTEADSYFSRLYDHDKVIADGPKFIQIATDYLNGQMRTRYAAQSGRLRERVGRLEQEIKDLTLTPEERVSELESLEARIAGLEDAMPEQAQLVTKINAARGEVRKAKTPEEKAAAEAKVAQLKENGGEELLEYNKLARQVTDRKRSVNFNVPGLAEKTERISQSIDNMVQANDRQLNRILERGQKLARELKKFDEEKLQKTIGDLRTQFHQLIEQSNAAQDRLAAQLAKLADLPPEQLKVLQAASAKEASRFERLNKLDERLEVAEALDYKASVEEIKLSIDEMITEISAKTLTRGEKIAAWKAKMAKLDPKKVDARKVTVEEKLRDFQREFYAKWESERLGTGVDFRNPDAEIDFAEHARDLANDIMNRIVGNNYGANVVDPEFRLPLAHGPLKDRTFHIPDEMIEEFLTDDVVEVMSRFSRKMAAQIELQRKFGDINLTERMKEIELEYDTLRTAAKTDKERLAIDADRKGVIDDLAAMRDMHLGTYLAKENASNAGRTARALNSFNYVRLMGGAALPNLSDFYGPIISHGLGRWMSAGIKPLFNNLEAIKGLKKEARYAGVVESASHNKMMTMAEIGDAYTRSTQIEKFMENMTHFASKWNGLNLLTQFQKEVSAIVAQDVLNQALIKKTDAEFLAWSGISDDMSDVLAKQLKEHGEEINGVLVANTDKWDNWDAIRAYRVAISRSITSDVVTRGVGDVPLTLRRPLWRVLAQFKTFNLVSHQRLFIRSMQLGQTQFLSGLIGMTTMGMLVTYLKALRGGADNWERFQEARTNPAYWIAEGLDQSGFFTLPIELGNITERASAGGGFAFNPMKTPLLAVGKLVVPDASLQGNSQRFAGSGVAGAVGGPTLGLAEDALRAAGGFIDAVGGEEMTKGEKRAAQRIIPYQSFLGMKEILQLTIDDSAWIDNDDQPY